MQPLQPSPLNQRHIKRRFDRAAAGFDGHDFVHAATRDGLLARLEPMSIQASTILDLGSATGSAIKPLAKRFRRSRITAVDLSLPMLRAGLQKRSLLRRHNAVQASAAALPFANQSVDLIFANLLLIWTEPPHDVFKEAARVLRKDGLLAFATLGPDSLGSLRAAWRAIDERGHVHPFADMHNLGDAAVSAGLREPVLDVDRLSVTYADPDALFNDLTATGGRNALVARQRGLQGKTGFRAMQDMLTRDNADGRIGVELEIVYGHCWGPGPLQEAGEFRLGVSDIGRRRR